MAQARETRLESESQRALEKYERERAKVNFMIATLCYSCARDSNSSFLIDTHSQAESMTEERDKLLDEVNELLQLQNELNDELRALRGDAPPATPSKGLLGGRGSASTAHLQEVYSQIDELEEELRTRSTETERLRRQLQEMEEEKAAAQLAHEAELTDMQRQRDDSGREASWVGTFAVGR